VPFVQNVTDDSLELPSIGITRTKPGDVVEVDELAARALDGHPCWEPHAGPAFTTPDPEAPEAVVSNPAAAASPVTPPVSTVITSAVPPTAATVVTEGQAK
jgi:hypothetical protein